MKYCSVGDGQWTNVLWTLYYNFPQHTDNEWQISWLELLLINQRHEQLVYI